MNGARSLVCVSERNTALAPEMICLELTAGVIPFQDLDILRHVAILLSIGTPRAARHFFGEIVCESGESGQKHLLCLRQRLPVLCPYRHLRWGRPRSRGGDQGEQFTRPEKWYF